jgi:hypothetical protein
MLAVFVFVFALAGCGGDGGGGNDSADATATTATTATTPRTPVLTARDQISSCLTGLGFKLTGGVAPNASDPDSAEYQIVMDSPRGGGYIGFYKNASRAQRVIKQLRKNAKSFKGAAVERHGAVNIVWVDLPDKAARVSVRGCLVD